MSNWRQYSARPVVAVHTRYDGDGGYTLPLSFGEELVVSHKCDRWLFGQSLISLNFGVFPETHICLIGKIENDNEDPSMRDNLTLTKNYTHLLLQVMRNQNFSSFNLLKDMIVKLSQMNEMIRSNNTNQSDDILEALSVISRTLNYDCILRLPNRRVSSLINIGPYSLYKLYHDKDNTVITESTASHKSKKKIVQKTQYFDYISQSVTDDDNLNSITLSTSNSSTLFHLFINALPFNNVLDVNSEFELRFSVVLNRGKEIVKMTEEYVVICSENGTPIGSKEMKAIFRNMDHKDIAIDGSMLYLVLKAIKRGNINNVGGVSSRHYEDPLRKLFAVAVSPINIDVSLSKLTTVDFNLFATNNDAFFGVLHEVIILEGIGSNQLVNKNCKVSAKIHMFQTSFDSLRLQQTEIFRNNLLICEPLLLPATSFDDVRNDFYLTLEECEFHEKSVEVTIIYRKETVGGKSSDFLGGISELPLSPNSAFLRMCVLNGSSRTDETCRMRMNAGDSVDGHFYFEIRHIPASYEPSQPRPKVSAYGFLALAEKGNLLADKSHKITLYKMGNKAPTSAQYFGPKNPDKETKTYITVRTQFSSNTLSPNEYFSKLTHWFENQNSLGDVLGRVVYLEPEILIRHHKQIIVTLLDIMTKLAKTPDKVRRAFNALVTLLASILEFRNITNMRSRLESFIKSLYLPSNNPKRHCDILLSLLSISLQTSPDDSISKALEHVFLFVIESAKTFNAFAEPEFVNLIHDFINIYKMFFTDRGNAMFRAQISAIRCFPNILSMLIQFYSPEDLLNECMSFLSAFDELNTLKHESTMILLYLDVVRSKICRSDSIRGHLLTHILERLKILFDQVLGLLIQNESSQNATIQDKVSIQEERITDCSNIVDTVGSICDIALLWTGDANMRSILSAQLLSFVPNFISLCDVFENRARNENYVVRLEDIMFCLLGVLRTADLNAWDNFLRSQNQSEEETMSFLSSLFVCLQRMFTFQIPQRWGAVNANVDLAIMKVVSLFIHSSLTCNVFQNNQLSKQHIETLTEFFKLGLRLLAQERFDGSMLSFSKDFENIDVRIVGELERCWNSIEQMGYIGEFHLLTYHFLPLVTFDEGPVCRFGTNVFFRMLLNEFSDSGSLDTAETLIFDALERRTNISMAFVRDFCKSLRKQFESSEWIQQSASTQNQKLLRSKGSDFAQRVEDFGTLLALKDAPKASRELRAYALSQLIDYLLVRGNGERAIVHCAELYRMHKEDRREEQVAHTLWKLSHTYEWDTASVPSLKLSTEHTLPQQSGFARKEALLRMAIDTFNRVNEWECIIRVLNELCEGYENHLFEYRKVSNILTETASYYKKILEVERAQPPYYRVGFYGLKFPRYLRNKEFIFKTTLAERLQDFTHRFEEQFSGVTILKKTDAPGREITHAENMSVLITPVTPQNVNAKDLEIANTISNSSPKSDANSLKNNERSRIKAEQKEREKALNAALAGSLTIPELTNMFLYAKPKKLSEKSTNEFLNLGLVHLYMYTDCALPASTSVALITKKEEVEFSPLENAIIGVIRKNAELEEMILKIEANALALNNLTMQLNGVILAGVNGGIPMYQSAFLVPEYLSQHPKDGPLCARLHRAIADQIDVLERGMAIHALKISDEMRGLHDTLSQTLSNTKREFKANPLD